MQGRRQQEGLVIPLTLNFERIAGLSHEIQERLRVWRPDTLGQLSRLPGVTPAAVASVLIHMKVHYENLF